MESPLLAPTPVATGKQEVGEQCMRVGGAQDKKIR